MLDALANKQVDIVIMDTFSLPQVNETLKKKHLKVAEMIDTNSGYGIVLGGIARSLKEDIKSALLHKEDMLTHFAEKMKGNLPVTYLIKCFFNNSYDLSFLLNGLLFLENKRKYHVNDFLRVDQLRYGEVLVLFKVTEH